MPVTTTLGAAVVGLGVGEQHARTYAADDQCTLRWVYDLDDARMHRLIAALGQGEAASTYDTILTDDAVDVVSIASYDDAHCTQVLAALRAGKHTFVEKPLCRSLEELRRLKDAWQKSADCHVASNLVLRAAPLYQWLKRSIQAGELGDIYAIDGDYLYGRLHKITAGWRNCQAAYSVMQGGGVHLVDLLLWLTGQRPSTVATVGNRVCTTGTAFQYNDYMAATFQFASGLVGRITANFGCVHRHHHVLRVFGTRGTFIYDDMGPRLHTSRSPAGAAVPVHLAPLPVSKGALIPTFVRAIVRGEDRRTSTQHEFNTISACLAADEALCTTGAVEVVYV